MNLLLPLKEGERPLFAGLQLVENIYKDFKRTNNVFESTEEATIFKIVTELYVISEILIFRENKGLRQNSLDVFELLTTLPLFFNSKQVKEWEVEKIWNSKSFIPYKEILIEYENSLNTLTPSSIYQVNNDKNKYIWQQWFIKTDIKEIINIIEDSAQRLMDWNKSRKEKSTLEQNINIFSKYLKLDKNITKRWYFLYVLGQQNSPIWNLFLKEFNNDLSVSKLLSVWEKALNLKTDDINSLLFEDSILVELGFLNNHDLDIELNEWSNVWKKINLIHLPNIHKKLVNSKNVLKLFLKETNNIEVLPFDWFSYIKNSESILNIIKNLKSGKILIYGNDFSGKKSFIFSILSTLNYKGYFINTKEENQEKEQHRISELFLADKLLENFKDSVLMINNDDKIYDTNNSKLLNKPKSLQIWVISDIKEVNQKFLKSFDFVFEMENPPLSNRLILTNKIFNHKNIAFRVAQSVKEPAQILKIGKLCHLSNNFSWDYISMLLYEFQKLIQKNDQIINLNKLEIEENIVNLVGYPTLIENLNNIVQFYKNPDLYLNIGAKANKGILLVGPPGTGKTHFARNLSKMANLPLFAPDTSVLAGNLDLIDVLFDELKRQAPCILFLDEIDTLIANPKTMFGVDLEKQKIVNTFLSHIDGIESNDGILIIGATHRKENFDPAAIRSGRLSKVIYLNMPNEKAREEIWLEHLKNKKVDSKLNIKELLQLSIGFSCSDIMEAVNKAAILAVEKNKTHIDISCFKIACDEVFWGYSDNSIIINEKQKEITAYHEAGHTLMALYYGYSVPRVTIRPRENKLGATHFVNEEGIFNLSKEDVEKRIQIMLGGICAEKLIFNHYENGGVQDLAQAKKIVLHAICEAGLGSEGPIHLGDASFWSNERKQKIENEENNLMSEQFEKTEEILTTNKSLLKEIAITLLEYKEISGEIMNNFKNKINNPMLSIKQKNMKENHILHKE